MSLHKSFLKSKLPPIYPGNSGFGGRKINRRRDYTPVSWDKYFDSYKDVAIGGGNVFRVYLKGKDGPLLVLLHGGGYSGLSWALLSTSMSSLIECRIAAVDLRGHGETHCTDDNDLSADTLSNDIGIVLSSLYQDEEPPPVILVGHSMGGAVAVHTVYKDLIPTVVALVVIDVVEGTALDALQSMQSFLRSRPPSFSSLPTAIEWCVRSGQVRNVESAKVSMPGQLKNAATNQCATRELHLQASGGHDHCVHISAPRHIAPPDSILEEIEDDVDEIKCGTGGDKLDNKNSLSSALPEEHDFKQPQAISPPTKYVWRIELSKTEKFWTGVDRLDRDLTIGQMQGKFQMQVLPQCGHAVHEDDPEKVAEAIATFIVRNKFANALCEFQRPFAAC